MKCIFWLEVFQQKKSKIIWEEIVDVKKIFDALTWLKRNNPLYNHIILPDTHDGLCLEKLNNPEFELQETENDNQSIINCVQTLKYKKQKIM